MSDIEILGRPTYLPKKSVVDRTEQSLTDKRIRNLSEYRREKKSIPVDLVYDRFPEDSQGE
jgi:hypothetical protein